MLRLSWLLAIPVLLGCGTHAVFDDADAPALVAAKTMDLDSDGTVETVQVLFSEPIADETVDPGDFHLDLIGAVTFEVRTNGDRIHDDVIHLSFPDGFLRAEAEPFLDYTPGSLEDLSGNALGPVVGFPVQAGPLLP